MSDTLDLNDLEFELTELQKLLAQDESLTVENSVEAPSPELYAFKENLLLAEISVLQNRLDKVTLCPDHGSLESVKHDLAQITTQLDFTLSHEVSHHTQLLQDKAEHARVYSEQSDIKEALTQHISTLTAESTDVNSARVLTNFLDKNKKANKLRCTLTLQMGRFIADTYPLPNQEDIEAFKKKRKKLHVNDISAGNNLQDLQGITELLMNKCLQEPNDPFLSIDELFWPPYVELLLRMNIIQRHPSDAKRIKLTPYHI